MHTLNEIYSLWFQNSSWWFNADKTIDALLEKHFYTWIDNIHLSLCDNLNELSKEELIGLIILFDQIPRHAYRISYGTHVIQYYLQYALKVVSYIQAESHIYNSLNVYEWSFIHLPLRHTQNVNIIHNVMKDIWIKLETCNDTNDILHMHRFIRATYERCPMNQGDFIKEYISIYDTDRNNKKWSNDLYKNLLSYAPEDEPFIDFKKVATNKIYNDCKNICKNKKTLIISLSGGIDSMICSYIFTTLNKIYNLNMQIIAVHIDYWNRKECLQEEQFLIDWCSYLDIPLYIRRITEINRKDSMDNNLRQVYETYTRNVRYSTYKTVWSMNNMTNEKDNKDLELPIVILGHNNDDCIENILTNITHKCKYDNLTGMDLTGIQDDIIFIRPLLNVTKKEIYAFSREFNIPHLQNSTPSWSMRGQIRDSVRPALEKWNNESIHGLVELSHNVSDLYKMMDIIIDDLLEKCKSNSTKEDEIYGSWNSKKSHIQTSVLFWKTFLYKLTTFTPSIKSLKAFETQLIRFKSIDINSKKSNSNELSVKVSNEIHIYMSQNKKNDYCNIMILKEALKKNKLSISVEE